METNRNLKGLELQYAKGSPEVSDETYDNMAELEGVEPKSTVDESDVGGEKIALPREIRDLPRVRNEKEFNAILRKMGKLGVVEYEIENKHDGVLLVSWREGGEIYHATKGSGKVGTNLTEKLREFSHKFNFESMTKRPEDNYVLTEVLIDREDERNFGTNARNYVTGVFAKDTITEDDVEPLILKYITSSCDNVYELSDGKTEIETCYTRPDGVLYTRSDGFTFIGLKQLYAARKGQGKTPIDGFVVKEVSVRGNRFEFIVKFPSETAVAEAESIVWQVGSTGKLTPVVYFNPVVLGYTRIECATGYSHAQFQKMGLSRGSKIVITKGGEIIPKIIEWEHKETKEGDFAWDKFSAPSHCPSCQSATRVVGAHIFCTRPLLCNGVRIKRLLRMLKLLGIKGYGESTLESLLSKNYSFEQTISEAIGNVHHVSKDVLLKLLYLCWDDGSKNAIHAFVKAEESKTVKNHGISVCLTGSFSLGKDEISRKLVSAGFTVHTSVTKATSIVCFGSSNSLDNPTTKMEKARKYGLKLMSETVLIQFLQLNTEM